MSNPNINILLLAGKNIPQEAIEKLSAQKNINLLGVLGSNLNCEEFAGLKLSASLDDFLGQTIDMVINFSAEDNYTNQIKEKLKNSILLNYWENLPEIIDFFIDKTEKLKYHCHLLDFLKKATKKLLTEKWEEIIENIFADLGMLLKVSRVYLFSNEYKDNKLTAVQRYEWVGEGISAQIK